MAMRISFLRDQPLSRPQQIVVEKEKKKEKMKRDEDGHVNRFPSVGSVPAKIENSRLSSLCMKPRDGNDLQNSLHLHAVKQQQKLHFITAFNFITCRRFRAQTFRR